MGTKQPPNNLFFQFIQGLQAIPGARNFSVYDIEVANQISALWHILYIYRMDKKIEGNIFPDEICRATKRSPIRVIFKPKRLDFNALSEAVNKSLTGATLTSGETIVITI